MDDYAEQELTDPANIDTLVAAAQQTLQPQATQLLARYQTLFDEIPMDENERRQYQGFINQMRTQIRHLPEQMGAYLSAPPEEAYRKLLPYRNAAAYLGERMPHQLKSSEGGRRSPENLRALNQLGVELHDLANPNNLLTQ